MAWSTPPLPATLNGIALTVETVQDVWARAVVRHAYPHRDGADLEDAGGEPIEVTVTGFIHGPTWLSQLEGIKASLAESGADEFVHPQFGTRTGKIARFSVSHSEERGLARVSFDFVEGNVEPAAFAAALSPLSAAAAVRTSATAVTAAAAAME